jgi:hypothetical protein
VAQALLDQQLRQLQTELDRKQQLDAQAAEHARYSVIVVDLCCLLYFSPINS